MAIPRACTHCGRLTKVVTHGECSACYGYRRTHDGAPRPFGPDGGPMPMELRPLRGPRPSIMGEKHPRWAGDHPLPLTGRNRARRRYVELGACVQCGLVPATQRHHRDRDTGNNTPENIAFLCKSCHDQAHNADRVPGPPVPCLDCGRLTKPTRKGRCRPCYDRWRGYTRKRVTTAASM